MLPNSVFTWHQLVFFWELWWCVLMYFDSRNYPFNKPKHQTLEWLIISHQSCKIKGTVFLNNKITISRNAALEKWWSGTWSWCYNLPSSFVVGIPVKLPVIRSTAHNLLLLVYCCIPKMSPVPVQATVQGKYPYRVWAWTTPGTSEPIILTQGSENQLDKSMARRHLKSPRSLCGRSLYLTFITKWSRSWSWMTYSHPLCSMSIGPPILGYSYFKIWQWKSLVNAMRMVKGLGHIWPWKFKDQGHCQGQTWWSHLRRKV